MKQSKELVILTLCGMLSVWAYAATVKHGVGIAIFLSIAAGILTSYSGVLNLINREIIFKHIFFGSVVFATLLVAFVFNYFEVPESHESKIFGVIFLTIYIAPEIYLYSKKSRHEKMLEW